MPPGLGWRPFPRWPQMIRAASPVRAYIATHSPLHVNLKAKATPLKGPTLTRVDIHFTIGHYDKGETQGKPTNNTIKQPCKDWGSRGQGFLGGPSPRP